MGIKDMNAKPRDFPFILRKLGTVPGNRIWEDKDEDRFEKE